jgi:Flp pilus assembly protein protease CpaA
MNIFFILHVLLNVFFCICLVWCAWTDHKKRIIPNKAILMILLASAIQIIFFLVNHQSVILYLGTLLMLIPMYVWWKDGKMGGGDLKLFVASGLLMGIVSFMAALLITLLAAGISGKIKKCVPMALYFAPGAIAITMIELLSMFTG